MLSDDLASRKLNSDEQLWHYTDFAGLKGILEGNLWASSLRYLNDSEEFRYGITIATRLLKEETTKHEPALGGKSVAALNEAIQKFFDDYSGDDTHISSLSAAKDDLSQWRAYSGSGPSFAVGFSPERLERRADASAFRLTQVIYSEEEVASEIAPIVKQHVQDMLSEAFQRGRPLLDEHSFALIWGNAIAADFVEKAPQFKHHKFSAEREWRLIRQLAVISQLPHLPIKYRRSGSLLIPYVDMPLHEKPNTESVQQTGNIVDTPISTILIGPSPHQPDIERVVNQMLRNWEFKVTVELSQVPFRNW